jgi:hypothetical protein
VVVYIPTIKKINLDAWKIKFMEAVQNFYLTKKNTWKIFFESFYIYIYYGVL